MLDHRSAKGRRRRQRRARTAEAKEERRGAIASAAWDLFLQGEYATVTIARVARRAGVAKGTVYLYYPTKEELFFDVTYAQLDTWLQELEERLGEARRWAVGAAVAVMCETLEPRRGLLRMMSIFPSIFENVTEFATLARLKGVIRALLARTGACLERGLPFLRRGEGARLLLLVHALVIGLWKLSDDSATGARQGAALQEMRIDFFTEFRDTITALLKGIEVQARRRDA